MFTMQNLNYAGQEFGCSSGNAYKVADDGTVTNVQAVDVRDFACAGFVQVGAAEAGGLSAVAHDDSLSGDGTDGNPLIVGCGFTHVDALAVVVAFAAAVQLNGITLGTAFQHPVIIRHGNNITFTLSKTNCACDVQAFFLLQFPLTMAANGTVPATVVTAVVGGGYDHDTNAPVPSVASIGSTNANIFGAHSGGAVDLDLSFTLTVGAPD